MQKLAQVPIGSSFFGANRGFTEIKDIGSLVSTLVSLGITVAGVILLLLLVSGGIGIIAGAGSDNPQQVESGKKAVTYAIIGFLVVFAAYWIVRLIEVVTGVTILG